MTAPTYLTAQDVADLLGISAESVRRAIKREDLRAFSYGHVLRIEKSEVDRFIAKHMTGKRRHLRSSA